MRLLVIGYEPKIAQALKQGLCAEGYDVALAGTGKEGFSWPAAVLRPDCPGCDVAGRDGLEVLAALCKQNMATQVLILTAKDAIEDRVMLGAGAGDYLVNPPPFRN